MATLLLRHPLMDNPHGQSSSTPGPSPSSSPPFRTKASHGPLAPLLEMPRRGGSGTSKVNNFSTVGAARLRVHPGSTWVARGARPPGMAHPARSPSQPALQWLDAHPRARCAPSPGRAARSRGRGSFHSLLSSLLSSAFRAGLTPGWAEPRAGWRGEAGAS